MSYDEWCGIHGYRVVEGCPGCVRRRCDDNEHEWGPEKHWQAPDGKHWVGQDCTKCSTFTMRCPDADSSYEAFLDLLARHQEHDV